MIDLLQEFFQIGEALAPEQSVDAEPVHERREALRFGPIVDIAPLASFRDQPSVP